MKTTFVKLARLQRRTRAAIFALMLQILMIFSSSFVLNPAIRPFRSQNRPILDMAASKSGAKLIESTEDYQQAAMSPEVNKPVLVFFTAPWCGPCRLSIPVVKDVVKLYAGEIDACEVCTDDLPDVASGSGVVSIPTIQMYCKGELMDTIVGCVAKSVLASAVAKVLEEASVRFGVGNSTNGET